MNRFGLTDIQAQAILDMRLQRLTGLEIEALRREYADILKTIARLEGILKSERKLIAVIRSEMLEIREKYGDDRRTELIDDDSASLPAVENKPVAEETVILLLRDGHCAALLSFRLSDSLIRLRLIYLELCANVASYVHVSDVNGKYLKCSARVQALAEYSP